MKKILIAAASAAAVAAFAAPALAQDVPGVSLYGNLGYSYIDGGDSKLSALGGRLGVRAMKFLGVEGEAAFGINSDTVLGVKVKMKSTYAGYVVGFAPVAPNVDVFARIGYGHDNLQGTLGGVTVSAGEDTVNWGGGVQAFFTPNDGVRGEFTRHDLRHNGGNANVWSIAYVRKF